MTAGATVLFVCTGNQHRSPLAERLLTARLGPDSPVRAASAGTGAQRRFGMDPATRSVLEGLGGDGARFTARPLTPELVDGAGLVLGLGREHREAAVRMCPWALRRCFTLREFVRLTEGAREGSSFADAVAHAAAARGSVPPPPPRTDDVADPWGAGYDALRACAEEIAEAVDALLPVLADQGMNRSEGFTASRT
ncbi:low molecular weight phosphatase family protein [Streptomyces sp. E11-3]|uniref:arsenate reductase/protein-tyrosine-phosphatase family protein n=1 Tax=Streptomyces sp. E11-3 TaxID=3110112 RepID=UPI003980654E